MEKIDPLFKGANKGHYSHGIVAGGMLYISGQLSIDPDTREVPKGGVSDHDITDISGWDEVNSIYAEFFGDHKPARAIVPVPSLHFGCKVEIEGIAEFDSEPGFTTQEGVLP
ncbi:MAG: endoribonuclease L-PSP [Spirochaetes bacterium]|nr:MAG: endoribonuclease L-PSP [Spirochaetota bacterium]